jgi:hypothetical protein
MVHDNLSTKCAQNNNSIYIGSDALLEPLYYVLFAEHGIFIAMTASDVTAEYPDKWRYARVNLIEFAHIKMRYGTKKIKNLVSV